MQYHFAQYGEVIDCVLMIDRATGRSRCFGFVTFKEQSSLDMVLGRGQVLDGKKVDCKPAVPTKQGYSGQSASLRTKKLFVGGLPTDITDDTFRNFFESFGEIEDSIVMYDRDTGRPRGFGFITFVDEASVELVLDNYDKNFISGKWVECKKATPKQLEGLNMQYVNPYIGFHMHNPYFQQPVVHQQPVLQNPPEKSNEQSDDNDLVEFLLGEDTEEEPSFDEAKGKTFN